MIRLPKKTVPLALADRRFVLRNGTSTTGRMKSRLFWWADNCDALAALLLHVPAREHNQSQFIRQSALVYGCGTSACAMGWAALGHVVPGLHYLVNDKGEIVCAVNGQKADWSEASYTFFGISPYAYKSPFGPELRTRREVSDMLREVARRYREEASR